MKKKQYLILSVNEGNLAIEEGKVVLNFTDDNLQTTSENKLIRLIEKHQGGAVNYEYKSKSYPLVFLVNLELGKVNKKDTDRLALHKKILSEGFNIKVEKEYIQYKLIKLLGGSHHKQHKQFYTKKDILDKLEPVLSDYREIGQTNTVKRLNSNALMTTDSFAIKYNLKDLNICIIPDNELTLEFPNLEAVYPYVNLTPEELELQKQLAEYKALLKEAITAEKEVKKNLANKTKMETKDFNTYKTISRWIKEDNRIPMLEEILNSDIVNVNKLNAEDPFVLYTKEQTIELTFDKRIFEVAAWNTGYEIKEVKELEVNNFDGMGLISKELGNVLSDAIQEENISKHMINGYQLRLKRLKGFFPVVDFKAYFKEKNIEFIYDIFGTKHLTKDIDILACESVFKAKLGIDVNGKKQWIYKDINDYLEVLSKDEDNYIEVANYTHSLNKNEYRSVTYQFLSSLNITPLQILALASEQGQMIKNVLNVYRKTEVDWTYIKYIQVYLNNILDNTSEDEYCETAIKMLNYNKFMVYDKKFANYLLSNIERELREIATGRIKVKSNYLYVTGDILAFLKYASCFQDKDFNSSTKIEGTLKEHEFYMSNTTGEHLLVRNPLMSKQELELGQFVDIKNDDIKYIKHLNNIIQVPINTSIFQQVGGFDEDGDKFHFIPATNNLKEVNLDWLIHLDRLNKKEENILENKQNKLIEELELLFPQQEVVTLLDIVRKSKSDKIQVNAADKAEGKISNDWCIDNISNFIMSADDKTGQITDINTSVLCQINQLFLDWLRGAKNEEELKNTLDELYFTNKIMKHFQGLMIDASKSGLTVEIPEIIRGRFKNRPYFYRSLRGMESKLDKKSKNCAMCLVDQSMFGNLEKSNSHGFFGAVQDALLVERKLQLDQQGIHNIVSFIDNANITYSQTSEYILKFKALLDTYKKMKRELLNEKAKINMFSKDDSHKLARELNKEKWSKMISNIRENAKMICGDAGVRANVGIKLGYENSQHDYSDFSWIIAADVYLTRLKNNQSENYLVTKDKNGDIEYLGKKYKLEVTRIPVAKRKIEKITDNTKLEDYTLALCVYNKFSTEEDKQALERLKNNQYESLELIEDKQYIKCLVDKKYLLGIDQKYYLKGNLKQRVGQDIKIKEIITVNKSSIMVLVDINTGA